MTFVTVNSTETRTNKDGEIEIVPISISMDKLDGDMKGCESNGKRFYLGSLKIPKYTIAHVNASVTVTGKDSSGVSDYTIFISKDKKGLIPYTACTGSDSPSSSSISIEYIHKTEKEEETIYLTGISGSNIAIEPLQFSALSFTKKYLG